MRMALRASSYAAIAVAVLSARPAAGQDDNLRELVDAVLGGELLVGAFPDESPVADAIPTDARVIGTLERGESITLVFGLRTSPSEAVDRVMNGLRSRGWMPPERTFEGSGFVTSGLGADNLLCRADGQVNVSATEGRPGEARVRLSVAPRGAHSICDMRPPARSMADSPVPLLMAPMGVRALGSGSSSGSGGEYMTHASLETGMAAEELGAFFAEQVEEAGWTRTTERSDNVVALRTWTRVDDDGVRLHGMLLVVAPPGTDGRLAWFRVVPLTGTAR